MAKDYFPAVTNGISKKTRQNITATGTAFLKTLVDPLGTDYFSEREKIMAQYNKKKKGGQQTVHVHLHIDGRRR